MKILHINTFDVTGGAARAAYRLHTGLKYLNQQSIMYVLHRTSDDSSVIKFTPSTDIIPRFRRIFCIKAISSDYNRYRKSRPDGLDIFSDDRSVFGSNSLSQLPQSDIINLHWVANFIDYQFFFGSIPRNTPCIWSLHDMNPFTGGCHYSLDCEKYNNGCGACPQLGSRDENDLSHQIWKRKRKAYSHLTPNNLQIVALNQWMAEKVRQSELLHNFPVEIIPNGVDTNIFSPRDQYVAREALEVPQDASVLLCVAHGINNRRKGFPELVKTVGGLRDLKNLFILSLGDRKPNINTWSPHLHLGYINNDRLLSLVYSAADLFVIPAQQDNLPNTVLESIACGTPVLGFDVGGIPDMISNNITGLLVPHGDIIALQTAIIQLLKDRTRLKKMAIDCRRIAVEKFSQEIQVRRYIELYEKVLTC